MSGGMLGFIHQLIRNLLLPSNAGPNDAAIVAGPDLPSCMQSRYAAAVFMRSQNVTTTGRASRYIGVVSTAAANQSSFFERGFYYTDGTTCGYIITGQDYSSVVAGQLTVSETTGVAGASGTLPVTAANRSQQYRWNMYAPGTIDNNNLWHVFGNIAGTPSGLARFQSLDTVSFLDNRIVSFVGGTTSFASTNALLRNGVTARFLTDSQFQACTANTALAVGPGFTAITGASVTVTAGANGALLKIKAVWDMNWTVAAAGNFGVGQVTVDGVAQTGNGISDGIAVNRKTVEQNYTAIIAAGTHTVAMLGQKTGAGGTLTAQATHTTLDCEVFE